MKTLQYNTAHYLKLSIIDHLKTLDYVQGRTKYSVIRGKVLANGGHEEEMRVYNTYVIYFNNGHPYRLSHANVLI